MFLDVIDLYLFDRGIAESNARICNQNVDMVDAPDRQLLDSISWVGGGGCINLHDVQGSSLCFGKII